MIKNTEHCVLCEHKKQEFTTGAYCGLTNKKPTFLNKCDSKEFGDTLEKKIIEVNTEIKLVEKTKGKTKLHVYTFLSFAAILLISNYFLISYLYEIEYDRYYGRSHYYLLSVPIVVGSIALYLIPFSIAPLNKYKREMSVAVDRKNDLDTVLKLYNYSYDIAIKLIDAPHDTIETEVDLKINSNPNV